MRMAHKADTKNRNYMSVLNKKMNGLVVAFYMQTLLNFDRIFGAKNKLYMYKYCCNISDVFVNKKSLILYKLSLKSVRYR